MSRVGPYLALLRGNRDFTRLYVAQLISFAGDWFATVALLGLVLEMTDSAVAASIVIVLQTAGLAFLSPLGGVLADRLDRRRLMVGADLIRIPIALMPLLARDPSTIWIALLGVFLLSAAGAAFEPASSAALPNLVDKDELSRANVLIGSAWGTMLAIGAALGGIVAATLGRDATFVINAISFGVSAALIIGIRRSFQQRRDRGDAAPESANPLKAIGSALGYARGSRAIASFLLSKSTFGVGTGVVLMLAIFGRQLLPEGDLGIGVLYASRGLGALAGPFIARSVFGVSTRGLIIGIGSSLAVVAVGYGLLPLAPTIWFAAAAVLTAHLGGGAQWMLSSYGLQQSAPDSVRGRLFGFDYGLVTLTVGISTLIAGAIAERASPDIAVWTMIGVMAIAGLGWVWFSRSLWRV
jgi:MFS family permease